MNNLPESIGCFPKPETLTPLALAYIGDAVYELYIRLFLAGNNNLKMKDLHLKAVSLVKADSQASFLRELEPLLTEEEQNIVRKGRNAKSGHVPKNADVLNYRYSTGFEALLGYLYLTGQNERLLELLGEIKPLMGIGEGMGFDASKTD